MSWELTIQIRNDHKTPLILLREQVAALLEQLGVRPGDVAGSLIQRRDDTDTDADAEQRV